MPSPRVILDCDTANEVDDQWAIAHLLGSGAAEVLAIVSVHDTVADGPGSRDLYQAEAERIVALCGREVLCRVRLDRWRTAPTWSTPPAWPSSPSRRTGRR